MPAIPYNAYLAEAVVAACEEALASFGRNDPHIPHSVRVPDVVGMTAGDAVLTLAREGLRHEVVRIEEPPPSVEGVVVAQEPSAGSMVRRTKTPVTLTLEFDPRPDG